MLVRPIKVLLIAFVGLTIAALIAFLIHRSASGSDDTVSTGSTYWMSDADLEKSIQLAGHGDKEAAFSVYEYYAFARYDPDLSKAWLRRAAELNNPLAAYNLAVLYKSEGTFLEAKKWAQRSVDLGFPDGMELLQSLGPDIPSDTQLKQPGVNEQPRTGYD